MIERLSRPYIGLALYALMALILFERGLSYVGEERSRLVLEREVLMRRQKAALKAEGELKAIIASQNDTEWIEQTLMRVLGLVPEGTKKIVFLDD